MSLEYLGLAVESIDPAAFPAVPLYTRQDGNYVLYREKNTPLTGNGLNNLREGNVDLVFVPAADADYVRTYYEGNLGKILAGEKLSRMGKNLVLCSLMVNYIIDVYQQLDQPWMYQKCRTLLNQFQLQIEDRNELLELLSKVSHTEVYLFTHSAQVAILSMFMHQKLFNSRPAELAEVGLGSMLLDIGMINVSSNIIDKAGGLTNDEYFRIKHHPRDGQQMARNMGINEQVALTIILRHHERYDGRGYPGHLQGNDIPLCAQIAAICDVYSALTNDRPFRPASTPAEALDTMRSERNLFHPELFDAFEAFMAG
ncbi:MAG TPA: HD domain-containing phosphohydrolase [Desulfuromonadaceae bacterium]